MPNAECRTPNDKCRMTNNELETHHAVEPSRISALSVLQSAFGIEHVE